MRNKLIDKDALIAWIESQIDSLERNSGCSGIFGEYQMAVYDKLLSFLDTLEVKEVDFDNDLYEEIYSHLDSIKDTADRMTSGNFMHHKAAIKFSANVIEKVLGLIGFKTQKGE